MILPPAHNNTSQPVKNDNNDYYLNQDVPLLTSLKLSYTSVRKDVTAHHLLYNAPNSYTHIRIQTHMHTKQTHIHIIIVDIHTQTRVQTRHMEI